MKIWIYLDGQQQGPFTMEELLDKPVDENTKVWFEGLPKWYPAGTLEQLKPLFDGTMAGKQHDEERSLSETEPMEEKTVEIVEAAGETVAEEKETVINRYAPGQRYQAPNNSSKPCPPTYIGWTVFLTVCCCSPFSLAGLIASICVTSYYNGGRIDKARKASEVAAWMVMIAIATGMISLILMSSLLS